MFKLSVVSCALDSFSEKTLSIQKANIFLLTERQKIDASGVSIFSNLSIFPQIHLSQQHQSFPEPLNINIMYEI